MSQSNVRNKAPQISAVKAHRLLLTERISEALSEGVGHAPWEQERSARVMRPFNPLTKTRFRGGNVLALMDAQQRMGSEDPRWLTFKQIKEQGLSLREGAKGTTIEFWMNLDRDRDEKTSAPPAKTSVDGEETEVAEEVRRPRLAVKHYRVFNGADVVGLRPLEPLKTAPAEPSAYAARLVHSLGLSVRPVLQGGGGTTYDDRADEIFMPPKAAFNTEADYYRSLVQVLPNWAAHKDRLALSSDEAVATLRTKIATSLLCDALGLPGGPTPAPSESGGMTRERRDAWLDHLKGSHNFIYQAAREATQLTDYLIGLDPALSAELEDAFARNLISLPPREEIMVADLSAIDTAGIVVPQRGVNENDPRWPAFEQALRKGAAPYAIEAEGIEQALALHKPNFTLLMDQIKINGHEDEETIKLITRRLVEDLKNQSVREKRWQHFSERVHDIADAIYGQQAVADRLDELAASYRRIIQMGLADGQSAEAIDGDIRGLLYGEKGRRPVDADLIADLMSPHELEDHLSDFNPDADVTSDGLLFDQDPVPADADDEIVLLSSDLEDEAAELPFLEEAHTI